MESAVTVLAATYVGLIGSHTSASILARIWRTRIHIWKILNILQDKKGTFHGCMVATILQTSINGGDLRWPPRYDDMI